jgi:hypothetical protein
MKYINTPLPILRIGVDIADTCHFLGATRGNLPGGWSCAGGWPAAFAHPLMYLHYRRQVAGERSFYLYLLRTDPDTLTVVGIVPGTGTTTIPEQRAVLDDFRSCVLDRPQTRRFPVVMVEPGKVAEFPDFPPPPEVQKVLDHWRGQFNNGAGFHPFDSTSWPYFLVNLHLTKRSISFDWLIDAFSLKHTIPERALLRLEERFYSSMELLRRHDEGLDYKREVQLKRSQAGPTASINPQPSAVN